MERLIYRKNYKIALCCCLFLALLSCKKTDNTVDLSGNYTGKYKGAEGGIAYWSYVGNADVALANNNYTANTSITSPNAFVASASSNGTYTIKGDSIMFKIAVTPPGTGQTINAALAGNYQYHFENDSLILTRSFQMGTASSFSQYRLKRN